MPSPADLRFPGPGHETVSGPGPVPISRRRLLGGLSAAAMGVSVGGVASRAAPARAAQADAVDFDSPPALQNPSPTGMTVAWAVRGRAAGWAEYGASPEALTERASASTYGLAAMHDRYLAVRLTGLEPGRRVYYRAAIAPIDFRSAYDIRRGEALYSDVFSFTTPNVSAETAMFAAINDTHENVETLTQLTDSLAQQPADYLLWNGDIFNDVFTDEQVIAQAFRPAGAAYAAETPVLFVAGNHDVRGPAARGLSQAFTPWAAEEPLGRCFAVRHGPLAILGLDTGEDKPDARPVFAGLADFEPYRRAQRDWLIAALKRPEISAAPFVVACCHIPLNGLPGHNGGDTDEGYAYFSRQSQQLWGPVLEQAGVQLVICGHMHQFRYDAPEANRPWGQLVGGGPQPSRATLIRGRATADALTVTAHRLDGTELGQWSYRAR